MPTYEYECSACQHSFELLQSISDSPLKKCPKCSKLKLHRLIGSGAGIIFKGSGFYETDYKNKGVSKGTSKSDSSKKDSSKKAEHSSKTAKTAGGCGVGCGCAN